MAGNQQPSPFERAPPEIREKVHQLLLPSNREYSINGNLGSRPPTPPLNRARNIDTAIMAVSQRCNDECAHILYGSSTFHFSSTYFSSAAEFAGFVALVGARHAAYIRTVTLSFHAHPGDMAAINTTNIRHIRILFEALAGLQSVELEIWANTLDVDVGEKATAQAQVVGQGWDMAAQLPRPHSADRKWIRRWSSARQYIHFWYVPTDFRMHILGNRSDVDIAV